MLHNITQGKHSHVAIVLYLSVKNVKSSANLVMETQQPATADKENPKYSPNNCSKFAIFSPPEFTSIHVKKTNKQKNNRGKSQAVKQK